MTDPDQNCYEEVDATASFNSSENPEESKPAKRGISKPSESTKPSVPVEKPASSKGHKRPIRKPNHDSSDDVAKE